MVVAPTAGRAEAQKANEKAAAAEADAAAANARADSAEAKAVQQQAAAAQASTTQPSGKGEVLPIGTVVETLPEGCTRRSSTLSTTITARTIFAPHSRGPSWSTPQRSRDGRPTFRPSQGIRSLKCPAELSGSSSPMPIDLLPARLLEGSGPASLLPPPLADERELRFRMAMWCAPMSTGCSAFEPRLEPDADTYAEEGFPIVVG